MADIRSRLVKADPSAGRISFGLRSFAAGSLNIVRMKKFVPCDIEDNLTLYRTRIVEIVFDPFQVEEVNARFRADGYNLDRSMWLKVIAIAVNRAILVWGGANSVFHLRRGEHVGDCFDEAHLAFQDLRDFIQQFKISKRRYRARNSKAEIDELAVQLNDRGISPWGLPPLYKEDRAETGMVLWTPPPPAS